MNAMGFDSRRGLTAGFCLANLLFVLALSLEVWTSYQHHVQHTEERVENTSLTLERSLSGMFDQIDVLLLSIQDELETQLVQGRIETGSTDRVIHRIAGQIPGLATIIYSDANGLVLANTGYPDNSSTFSLQDREYFAKLRKQPDAGMVSSKPVVGKVSGSWVIIFARAYRDPRKNFAGVVLASVDLERFSSIFAALKLGERGQVTLIDPDFSVLASQPPPANQAYLGRRLRQDWLIAKLQNGLPLQTMRITPKTDGVERIFAVRKLESRPYWIGVGLSVDDELAPWRRQAGIAIVVMLVFAVLTGVAARQMALGWRRQEEVGVVLESTLEATDEGILVVSGQGRVLHSNAQFAQMWPIPEKLLAAGDENALFAQLASQLADPEDFIRGVETLNGHSAAKISDTLELADGRTFEKTSSPMLIGGKLRGRVWCFRDVSDFKSIERLLKFVAQRSWVESGQDFLPALAECLGQLLKVDYALIDRLGDEPGTAETVGLYAHGAVIPNLSYSLTGTPCNEVIGKDLCIYRESIQQLFPDDGLLREMNAESYMGLPLWDSAGQPIGLIALLDGKPLKDVDKAQALLRLVAATAGAELERQREEKILRRERDRAQGYLDTVEAVIVVLDSVGRIVRINRKGCQLLGWQDVELIGKSWFETCLPQPTGNEVVYPYFLKIIAGEIATAEYFENEIVTRSGERRHIAWHNGLLHDEHGQIIGTVSAGEDITERRLRDAELDRHRNQLETLVDERTQALSAALDQAESSNRAKSSFLSNMSHELRTPLNAVIGFSKLMSRSETLGEGEKKSLEIINRSGEHLLTLINDVLELSKIEAGHVRLLEDVCDVSQLLQDIADMLRPRAEQVGLTLALSAEGLPAALRVDTTKLRQVLINLLGNAVKFTRQGGVSLSVRGRPGDDQTARLEFSVSDTGIGIAPEDRQRIFEPFTQIVTHATSAGTGLGLTITRQYLAMLGGELSIESIPGQGSVFSFVLDLPLVEARIAKPEASGEVIGLEEADHGKRILIADDDADSRELLCRLLKPIGFFVAEAADGVEAVVQAAGFHPDLIIMDWRMPKLNGLAATKRILADCSGDPPKVIMLTASAFEEDRQHALSAGVSDFLRKPLQEILFYASLERHLGIVFRRVVAGSETDSTQCPPPIAESLIIELFAALPEVQREAILRAIAELNPGKLSAELALIEHQHSRLAQGINVLARQYRYAQLWAILKASPTDEGSV